jgi:hypothetical protein
MSHPYTKGSSRLLIAKWRLLYKEHKPQPKPIVRFRVNGGGTFVHTGVEWVEADREVMTNVANTLFNMVRFADGVRSGDYSF